MGSPPQVRGKPQSGKNYCLFVGITPAGAGKTYEGKYKDVLSEDHPRRCGENTEYG